MKTKYLLLLLFCLVNLAAEAQTDYKNYKMAGPYEVVARDGQYRKSKGGSERDMKVAWECAKAGNNDKAQEIIHSYAQTLQRFDGHDAPLCTIQAYWLLRAMVSLTSEPSPKERKEWEAMVRRAILPVMDKFEADSPYANGNWGHIVNRCRMAAAIFLKDKALYQHAVDIYLHANDNGSLPNYVGASGQCQETGRDQGHAQLGLGAMCEICEMAWEQGDWSATYPDYSNFTRAATDARLAYHYELRWKLKDYGPFADADGSILNDWAQNCKGVLRIAGQDYANNIPDSNEYLLTIQAYQFANAAELLRGYSGWQAADFERFQNWMRQTFADLAYQFLENHGNQSQSHYWANWDLAALTALYSVGVLCDDQTLVDYSLNYVNNGQGMGSAANVITDTHNDPDSNEMLAQCQESGRDQGHSTLDVTLMGALCRMAQSQGVDLFTPYKALEMAEYVGKYNLQDKEGNFVYTADAVPFTVYNNGEYNHSVISAVSRGIIRPCWELFHAYAKANNKEDAYVEAWVKYLRDKNAYGEGAATSTDELGFGTLMFATPGDLTTGITENKRETNASDNVYYNLNGQRVDASLRSGLYIVNGRKVVVK